MARHATSSFLLLPKPADTITQKEALAYLANVRKSILLWLNELIRRQPEVTDELRTDIDAHFRMLGLINALTRQIESTLPGSDIH